jgi:hexosaminidase
MPVRNLLPALLFVLSAIAAAIPTVAIPTAAFAAKPALVPLPAEVLWNNGECTLGSVIATDDACKAEGEMLAAMLQPATGVTFKVVAADKSGSAPGTVILTVDKSLAASKEAYRLLVTPEAVQITGASPAGVFYGIQTLRQMLPEQIFASAEQKNVQWKIPCATISDQPRFAWRGFMLDDSRHFLGAEYAKRLIDLMAMHKLNLLHWHLSDDDGFRIEIKSYPKLTEVGGWRGTECKLPNTRPGETHRRYGGFYTQEQIRDIVAYAAARHIDIMPEIDIPGHSGAVAVSYPEILCQGKTKGNVWCVGREENYTMLDRMVAELAYLFPFEYVHIGGDEVNSRAWSGCPRCKALMAREKIASLGQIQGYFTHRYEEILRKHGRKMIGWNEILNDKLSKDSAIMAWESDKPGYKAAAGGWDVVFCPGQHCYLDMKESRLDTWGQMWAGIVPLSAVCNFDPLARPGLTDEQKARVLGVQACLWTEFITSNERGDYKTWPRLCAIAEMGWTPQSRRKFADFMDRLGPEHLDRLGLLGVSYRVPDPELQSAGRGLVKVDLPFTGADIHYTTDGSEPTEASPHWTGEPIHAKAGHAVAARTFLPGGRSSHTVTYPAVKK